MTLTDERRQELYDEHVRREQLEKMLTTHECAVCHGPLVLLATPYPTHWYLACGQDRTHVGFAKIPSLTQRYLRGERLPLEIINRIEARRRHNMEEGLSPQQQQALAPYQGIRTLTKQQATEVLRTIWPKAPDAEILKAAMLCKDYGLHPLMKHIFLLPFKNKKTQVVTWATVLGIAATRLIASRRGSYSYVDGPRLMTDDEQQRIFGEVDPDKLWAITVVQDNAGNRAPGYGNWPKADAPYGTDKGNSKSNMAFIRSERNALQRLRPGEIPTGVDVVDPSFIEADMDNALPAGEPELDVDEETGEVQESGPADPTEHPGRSSPSDVTRSEEAPDDTPKRPPSDIKMGSLADLFNAAQEWFGIKNWSDIFAILNVRDKSEIADVKDAWATICAHRLEPEDAE